MQRWGSDSVENENHEKCIFSLTTQGVFSLSSSDVQIEANKSSLFPPRLGVETFRLEYAFPWLSVREMQNLVNNTWLTLRGDEKSSGKIRLSWRRRKRSHFRGKSFRRLLQKMLLCEKFRIEWIILFLVSNEHRSRIFSFYQNNSAPSFINYPIESIQLTMKL